MVDEAEKSLADAAGMGTMGRFQLEAAIQSVHSRRATTRKTDWQAISVLYEGLVRYAPTMGALVGRAAALGEACGASTGLKLLNELPAESIQTYQPYWALRAHLLVSIGQVDDARAAYELAIGLSEDEAVRTFLMTRRP